MGMRILLLLTISWIVGLTAAPVHDRRHAVLGAGPDPDRRRPVPALEGDDRDPRVARGRRRRTRRRAARRPSVGVLVQIVLLDIVFSLDSVLTAVGMANDIPVMIAAVVIAVGVMLFASGPALARSSTQHPTVKMLALRSCS